MTVPVFEWDAKVVSAWMRYDGYIPYAEGCDSLQAGLVKSTEWMNYFMRIALEVSTKSKDPKHKVGAIAVEPVSRRILATGYNGFPGGVKETPERWERPTKYDFIVHAEKNIVATAAKFGISLNGCDLFVTLHPCVDCASFVATAGIKRIMYLDDGTDLRQTQEWHTHLDNAKAILKESGIRLIPITEKI